MKIDLSNRTALIGGGSDGIGKAIAIEMSKAGARIILLARNEAKIKGVMAQLEGGANKHLYRVVDFQHTDQIGAIVSELAENYPIDILVNNSGGPASGPIFSAEISAFESAFRQHLLANHVLAQALIPGMKGRSFGRIINVISTSVKVPLKGLGVSNTIRGAVANWSKTLANETASWGITVNNILPGATKTERLKDIIEQKSKKLQISISEAESAMLAEIPAGRFAAPNEPAFAAVFLASDQASYITGTNMVVDGGRTGNL